jgi:oligo-1,6-glucosidase
MVSRVTETGLKESDREWWKEAVVYQIYPRSFNDSDGDGVGDIPGIVEKLDYLDDLGVDVVWLSPVYESPNADNGYDIADYRAIMDEMGTMSDFEELLAGIHDRDIRLVMDLVVNHTSDEHEWFRKSRRREGKYGDYYIWRDPVDGGPPNNWESAFGGSAWTFDEERGQYYLHLFDTKQPDLDWTNPAVREDIYEMMTWWLEKGVDGFRMDVVNLISKREGLPDGDENSGMVGVEHFANGPRIHEYLREMYDEVLSEYDCMTVAEMPFIGVEDAREYLGEDGDGLNTVFHFEHMDLTYGDRKWSLEHYDERNLAEEPLSEWDLTDLKAIVDRWQRGLADEDWNSIYWGNHDHPRCVSRFGNDGQYRRESATLLATYLLTMRGTSFVYQGDEIGTTSADWHSIGEMRDVEAVNYTRVLMEEYDLDFEDVAPLVRARSRDNARTPMQWSDGHDAGFTDGDPWIKVTENYPEVNVERAREDPRSVWHYYRELVALRHSEDVLVYGDFEMLLPDDEQVFASLRTLGEDTVLVALNFSEARPDAVLPADVGYEHDEANLLAGNYDDADGREPLALRPWEARVYRL